MKILAFLIALLSLPVHANKLSLCDQALKSCEAYSEALNVYNGHLKEDEKALADKLATEQDRMPYWFWVGVGFVAGGMAYTGLRALGGK